MVNLLHLHIIWHKIETAACGLVIVFSHFFCVLPIVGFGKTILRCIVGFSKHFKRKHFKRTDKAQ